MIKYCFITDEETGLVQLGVGCPDEYYEEIGMQQRDVEQSEIDYQWYLTDKCPHYTEQEKIALLRERLTFENDEQSEIARENQVFTVTLQDKECSFQTTRKTQQDLATAKDFIQITGQPYQWFSDNNQEVYLTLEDVINISTIFIQKANVYPKWSEYKTVIDNAQTLEELEAIEIIY